MKKLALSSLIAVFAVSAANATTNNFVGGSIALSTDDEHATVLKIAPEFGWKYNSDWDLGVEANFGYDHSIVDFGADVAGYSYGAGAFARYNVTSFGGVKLLLKGTVGADFFTLSADNDVIDGETLSSISASIIPMITYDISDAFTLYANLNFLGVHANYMFENKDISVKDSWSVGAIANSDSVVNTKDFQIGFLYKF